MTDQERIRHLEAIIANMVDNTFGSVTPGVSEERIITALGLENLAQATTAVAVTVAVAREDRWDG